MGRKGKKCVTFSNAGFDASEVERFAKESVHQTKPANNLNWITLKCFNQEKITTIIVGTFTPFDARENRCMFYSSDANNMYEYIDDELPKLKKLLAAEETKANARERIINILESKGIAFLDVVGMVSDGENPCAADSSLGFFCLDKESFAPFLGKGIRFIVNSRTAETGFLRIARALGIEETCTYCPQTLRGKKAKDCSEPKTKENLKLRWRTLLYGEKHS